MAKIIQMWFVNCCWLEKWLGVRWFLVRLGVDCFLRLVGRGHSLCQERGLEWINECKWVSLEGSDISLSSGLKLNPVLDGSRVTRLKSSPMSPVFISLVQQV